MVALEVVIWGWEGFWWSGRGIDLDGLIIDRNVVGSVVTVGGGCVQCLAGRELVGGGQLGRGGGYFHV